MMTEPGDPLFRLFHRYNKLVRRGLVKPLECSKCDAVLITAADESGDLILRCFACESKITPGLATVSQVRAVVTEHFEEE